MPSNDYYQDFHNQVCDDLNLDHTQKPDLEFVSRDEMDTLAKNEGVEGDAPDAFYSRDSNTVYVCDDMGHEETMNSIAHENKHCQQHEAAEERWHDKEGNKDPNAEKYKEAFDEKDSEGVLDEQNTDLYTEQDAREFADSYSEDLGHDYRSNNEHGSALDESLSKEDAIAQKGSADFDSFEQGEVNQFSSGQSGITGETLDDSIAKEDAMAQQNVADFDSFEKGEVNQFSPGQSGVTNETPAETLNGFSGPENAASAPNEQIAENLNGLGGEQASGAATQTAEGTSRASETATKATDLTM